MTKLWEDKYVDKIEDLQTLDGLVRYHKDKWGAVLYVENKLQSKEPQRIYINRKEYLDAISHLRKEKKNNE